VTTIKVLRHGIALLVTTAFAVYVVPVSFCVSSILSSGSCDVRFGWTPVFLLCTLGVAIVVGLPLYMALNRYGRRKWWHRGLVGAVVGCMTALVLGILDTNIVAYWFAVFAAPIGFATGVLFSLLATAGARPDG
jgi:hypothetical protein